MKWKRKNRKIHIKKCKKEMKRKEGFLQDQITIVKQQL